MYICVHAYNIYMTQHINTIVGVSLALTIWYWITKKSHQRSLEAEIQTAKPHTHSAPSSVAINEFKCNFATNPQLLKRKVSMSVSHHYSPLIHT